MILVINTFAFIINIIAKRIKLFLDTNISWSQRDIHLRIRFQSKINNIFRQEVTRESFKWKTWIRHLLQFLFSRLQMSTGESSSVVWLNIFFAQEESIEACISSRDIACHNESVISCLHFHPQSDSEYLCSGYRRKEAINTTGKGKEGRRQTSMCYRHFLKRKQTLASPVFSQGRRVSQTEEGNQSKIMIPFEENEANYDSCPLALSSHVLLISS